MVTEYEIYSDERTTRDHMGHWLWLGGVVCTDTGRSRLLGELAAVRNLYGLLSHEMKWARVSERHWDAYRSWVNVVGSPW